MVCRAIAQPPDPRPARDDHWVSKDWLALISLTLAVILRVPRYHILVHQVHNLLVAVVPISQ